MIPRILGVHAKANKELIGPYRVLIDGVDYSDEVFYVDRRGAVVRGYKTFNGRKVIKNDRLATWERIIPPDRLRVERVERT